MLTNMLIGVPNLRGGSSDCGPGMLGQAISSTVLVLPKSDRRRDKLIKIRGVS